METLKQLQKTLIKYLQSIDWENMSYLDRLIYFSKWLDKNKRCPLDNLPLQITGTYIPGVSGAFGKWYKCPNHQLILRLNWDAPYLLPELNELLKKLTNQQYSFSGVEDSGVLGMATKRTTERVGMPLSLPTQIVAKIKETKRCPICGETVKIRPRYRIPNSPVDILCPKHGLMVREQSGKPPIISRHLLPTTSKPVRKPTGRKPRPMITKPVVQQPKLEVRPPIRKTLRKGDTGTSVSLLKYRLGVIGFPIESVSTYDEVTEEAVKKAQSALNLPVTGIADSVTINRINIAFQKKVDMTKKPTTFWEMWTKGKRKSKSMWAKKKGRRNYNA